MSALPILVAGLALGLLGLSSSSSSKKDATPAPGPTPTPTPGGGGPPKPNPDDYLPGTTTLKSRVRTIDASTPTPGQFAAKYSGVASRWKEIPAANPSGAIYPSSPPINVAYPQYVPGLDPPKMYGWGPDPDPYAPAGAGAGLLPWAIGQQVVLPESWKG